MFFVQFERFVKIGIVDALSAFKGKITTKVNNKQCATLGGVAHFFCLEEEVI